MGNAYNITVANCTFSECTLLYYYLNPSRITIIDTRFDNLYSPGPVISTWWNYGINLLNITINTSASSAISGSSFNLILANSTIIANASGATGIGWGFGSGITIQDNKFKTSGTSIYSSGGTLTSYEGARVLNNYIESYASNGCVYHLGDNDIYRNIVISGNQFNCSTIRFATDNAIRELNFTDNTINNGSLILGDYLQGTIFITNNSFNHQSTSSLGLTGSTLSNSLIANNTFNNYTSALSISGSVENLTIIDNVIANSTLGFNITGGRRAYINNITFSNVVNPLVLTNALNTTINNTRTANFTSITLTGLASINFTASANFTVNQSLMLLLNMSNETAYVNSTLSPELNTSAIIRFYGVNFTSPKIMMTRNFNDSTSTDYVDCPPDVCNIRGYNTPGKNVSVHVTHFSWYKIADSITSSNITNSTGVNNTVIDTSNIDNSTIRDSTINNSNINRSLVLNDTIVNSTILQSVVVNSSVTNTTIDNTTINASYINQSDIDSSRILSSNITASTISQSNITNTTVNTSSIMTSNITNSQIQNSTVTNSTFFDGIISDSRVNASNIANSSVTDSDLLNVTMTDTSINTSTFTRGTITDSQVQNSTLVNTTVTTSTIDHGTIDNSSMDNTSVTSSAINRSNIDNTVIDYSNITQSTINASNIDTTTITFSNVTNSTISNGRIENSSVYGSVLVNVTLNGTIALNCTIRNASATGGTLTNNTIQNSTTLYSNISSSIINNSLVNASTVNASTVETSNVINTTLRNALVINSTLENDNVTGRAIINNLLVANCTYDISRNATLTADIHCAGTDGVNMTADNITLDCAGKTMLGSKTGTGIHTLNRNRVSVAGCSVINFSTAILIEDTQASSVIDSRALNSTYGIVIENSTGIVLRGINSTGINASSLYIINGLNVTANNTNASSGMIIENRSHYTKINYTDAISFVSNVTIGYSVNLTNQTIRVNSTLTPEMNRSAILTWRNATIAIRSMLVDPNDNGAYAVCSAPRCIQLADFENTFSFNVTGFTTYSYVAPVGPTVTNASPAAYTRRPLFSNILVSANVTDLIGVDTVFVNITKPDSSFVVITMDNNTLPDIWNATFNDTTQLGQYFAYFFANNSIGLVNYTVNTTFNATEISPPNVSNASADPSRINLTGATNITADVTDSEMVDTVTANITRANGSIFEIRLTNITSHYNATIQTQSGDPVGQWNVTIIANDSNGNINNSITTNFIVNDTRPPTITFSKQTPANISTFNLFNTGFLRITYNLSDETRVNATSSRLSYKTNTSTSDIFMFVNGSDITGFQNITGTNTSLDEFNINWTIELDDHKVYPATFNLPQDTMESATKQVFPLTTTDTYIKIRFFNVSSQKQNNNFMFNAYNRSGAGAPLRIYYCNQSYDQGNPTTSDNCTNFFSMLATEPVNSTPYHTISFAVNTTTGDLNGVHVTSTSYFLLRGQTADTGWNASYVTNMSRNGTIQTTSDSGATWTNLTGTADAHLHQFDGTERFHYYLCANDTLGNGNCSPTRSQDINATQVPPTPPSVYRPTEGAYRRNITINYTAAASPTGIQISEYNISLTYPNATFLSTIQTNNSQNLSYILDSTTVSDGQYTIRVEACDVTGLCSNGYSANITIDNTPPNSTALNITPSIINKGASTNITLNASDNVAIDRVIAQVTHPNGTSYNRTMSQLSGATYNYTQASSITDPEGLYLIAILVNDTAGNSNNSQAGAYNISNMTIANSSVDNSTIRNSTIFDSSINDSVVAASYVRNSSLLNDSVQRSSIENSTIDRSTINSSAINNSDIESSSAFGSNITSSTISLSNITNSRINTSDVRSSNITSSVVDNTSIQNSTILLSTIDQGMVQNSSVDNSSILHSTVNKSNIDNSVIDHSNLTGSIVNASNLNTVHTIGSNITNSTVVNSVLENGTVAGSVLQNVTLIRTVAVNCTIRNASASGGILINNTIENSTTLSSNVSASIVNNSNVNASTINSSIIYGATIINSTIINSTVSNDVLRNVFLLNNKQVANCSVNLTRNGTVFSNITCGSGGEITFARHGLTLECEYNAILYGNYTNTAVSIKSMENESVIGCTFVYAGTAIQVDSSKAASIRDDQAINSTVGLYVVNSTGTSVLRYNASDDGVPMKVLDSWNTTINETITGAGTIIENSTAASINFTSQANFSVNNILTSYINMTNTSATIYTLIAPGLNTSAIIRVKGATISDPHVLVDQNDDGIYQQCETDRCTIREFVPANFTFTFNVSHFTTYSVQQVALCGDTISSDSIMVANASTSGNCLQMNQSSITLDCKGRSITGNRTSSVLINTSRPLENITIKNCILTNASTAIHLSSGGTIRHATLVNNTISNTTAAVAFNGSDVRVIKNLIQGAETGITYTGHAIISNNTFLEGMTGVYARNVNETTLAYDLFGNVSAGVVLHNFSELAHDLNFSDVTGSILVIDSINATINATIAPATVVIENTSAARVNFTAAINFSRLDMRAPQTLFNMTNVSVQVNSTLTPVFNTSAIITFTHLPLNNPRVFADFEEDGMFTPCPSSVCTNLSFNGSIFAFNVTRFSTYMAREAPACGQNVSENITVEAMIKANASCFSIENDNVLFDCAGNTIAGNGTSTLINTTGHRGIVIRNCRFENATVAVGMTDTNDTILLNNTFVNASVRTGTAGSAVAPNSNITLSGNFNITELMFSSTYFSRAENNSIQTITSIGSNNTLRWNNLTRYTAMQGANNTLIGNRIGGSGVPAEALQVSGSDQIITGNNFTNGNLAVAEANTTKIWSNTFDNACVTPGTGIKTGTDIKGNTFTGCIGHSIDMGTSSQRTNITNNIILSSQGAGVQVSGGRQALILNNTINATYAAVNASSANLTTIANNTINAGGIGNHSVRLDNTTNTLVDSNLIANTTTYGAAIWIDPGSRNTRTTSVRIINNTLIDTPIAIGAYSLSRPAANISDITIDSNTIRNATVGIRVESSRPNVTVRTVNISRNLIRTASTGIIASTAHEVAIYENDLNNSAQTGIAIAAWTVNATIFNNTISNSSISILISNSSGIISKDNLVKNSSHAGLYINASYNVATYNLTAIDSRTPIRVTDSPDSVINATNAGTGVIIENSTQSRINFTGEINFTINRTIGESINLTSNRISVNSTNAPQFNTSAVLTMIGLSLTDERVERAANDESVFAACPGTICTVLPGTASDDIFNVTQFTTYQILGTRIINSSTTNTTVTNSTVINSNLTNSSISGSYANSSYSFNSTIINTNATQSAINNSLVRDSNIDNSSISTSSAWNSTIDNSTVAGSNLTGDRINASAIFNSTITNSTILTSSVNGSQVQNASVTNSTIISSAINNSLIANSTASASNITYCIVNASSVSNSTLYNCSVIRSVVNSSAVINSTLHASNVSASTINTSATDSSQIDNSSLIISGAINTSIDNSSLASSQAGDSRINKTALLNSTASNSTVLDSTLNRSTAENSSVTSSDVSMSAANDSAVDFSSSYNSTISASLANGSALSNSTITQSNLTDTNATSSSIENSSVVNSTVLGSDITSDTIENSTVFTSNVSTSTINRSLITSSNVTNSTVTSCRINQSQAPDSTLTQTNLTLSDLQTVTADLCTMTNSNLTDSTALSSRIDNSTVSNTSVIGSQPDRRSSTRARYRTRT